MCVILIPTKRHPTPEELNEAQDSNPHGAGMAWKDKDGKLEIDYISRPKGKWIWEYEKEWQTVAKWTILEHVPLDKDNPIESYKKLGFRPLTENTFLKLDEVDLIPKNVLLPTGYYDEEEELDSDDSLKDFIVPDEEGEAFTLAPLDSDFVKETHEIVNHYNNWEPKNRSEKKVKTFVDGIAHKYKQKDDNRQFAQGKSVDYDHPPMKKQRETYRLLKSQSVWER